MHTYAKSYDFARIALFLYLHLNCCFWTNLHLFNLQQPSPISEDR